MVIYCNGEYLILAGVGGGCLRLGEGISASSSEQNVQHDRRQ